LSFFSTNSFRIEAIEDSHTKVGLFFHFILPEISQKLIFKVHYKQVNRKFAIGYVTYFYNVFLNVFTNLVTAFSKLSKHVNLFYMFSFMKNNFVNSMLYFLNKFSIVFSSNSLIFHLHNPFTNNKFHIFFFF
jgi:hypothetical protein